MPTDKEPEWDAAKAARNKSKHGVTFKEGYTVFDDPNARRDYDDTHSNDAEERWTLVGLSFRLRLLSVTYVETETTIRLISARRATKAEGRRYGSAG